MNTHLREAWRRVATSTPPPNVPPEVAPIPAGHERLWHRTAERNIESIRRSGLGAEHSRQLEFSGEMVWGTKGFRSAVDVHSAPASDWAFVEYHVPWDRHSSAPREGGAYTSGSVPPSSIIHVWEPWHFAVWTITDEVASGRYALEDLEFLRDEQSAFAQALDWLATHPAPVWMGQVKP